MNKQVEANLSMIVSKALGGFNMNALKYLLPLWIAPVTGVTFRLVFGAAAFWLIDIFCKPECLMSGKRRYNRKDGSMKYCSFCV